jgi:hypothetical protein
MAYDKEVIFTKAKAAIEENNLFFIEDIVAFLPCSKPTFYEFFPVESNELNTLKELLDDNKVQTKVKIRKKLEMGEKAAELLALYKLICSDEERRSLQMQHIDHTTKGNEIKASEPLSNEIIEKLIDKL